MVAKPGQVMELFDDKTCIINTTTGAFGIPFEFLMPCSNSNTNSKNVGVQRFTKSLRAIIDSGADSILISNPEAIIPNSLTECECELSNFLGQGSSQITQKGSIALRDPNISNGPVVIIRDAYICSDSRRTLLPDITCYKQGVHFQNDPRSEVRVVDVESSDSERL